MIDRRARLLLLTGLAAVLVLGPVASHAQDTVFKTDGARLKGKIVDESTRTVTIDTPGGRLTVRRSEIARIERDGDVFKEFEARRDKLSRTDAEGWFTLGRWCQDQSLYPQAIDCFNEVVRIDWDHAEARWELGYRKLDGKWVTEEDWYRARGYVQWEGRWVSPGDRDNLAAGLVLVDGRWVPAAEAEASETARAPERAPERSERSSGKREESGKSVPAGAEPPRRQPNPYAGWRPLGGQVGQPPLSPEEREKQLEAGKQSGGWKVAFSSKYYDFFSNGALDEVKEWAAVLDLMCDEYKRIFKFDEEITRPFPVHLYANQQEFMSRTGQGPGTGGFYDGKKIVGFHGGLGSLTTLSVLFHEGTHQFQGLVMGQNMWRAKIWLIEGLAVFFEASEVQGRKLNTGAIPATRLANVKRAITSGSYVHLRDLIRMDQAQFGALHYAHAWSLIYFLVHGTKGGKKRFVEYWEQVKAGHDDQVALFEQLFDKPMEEIEAAWKEYVLRLSPR